MTDGPAVLPSGASVMNEEAAFLYAICKYPDEDLPRLAFADWLDEQGGSANTAWAELIRVQVALARGSEPDQVRLVERERTCRPVVAAAWGGRIGLPEASGLAWGNWRRGFPETLESEFEALCAAR